MKRLAILGSTGSIGVQTLDVAARFPERYSVTALAAGRNVSVLADQVMRFRPGLVSVADADAAADLRAVLRADVLRADGLGADGLGADGLGADAPEIAVGEAGLRAVASADADLVVSALVGAVGLEPTLAAIACGRDVALANKEVMVMAGALVRREVEAQGVALLPVDSEHNAIFQALAGQRLEDVARLVLTASGGPFRTWSAAQIARARIEDALDHPNWDMGPKVTIDSATLMNKGLEVIEARWLFDVPPERVDVVVHPQSIVHSLVEFVDGSVLAQLGVPDMRVPIAVVLAHPERLPLELPRLDLTEVSRLDFEEPDRTRFPCLDLAFAALGGGEAAPAVLNAANEISVEAFLAGEIPFPAIAAVNGDVLSAHVGTPGGSAVVRDLVDVREADAWARERARETLAKHRETSSAGGTA